MMENETVRKELSVLLEATLRMEDELNHVCHGLEEEEN